MISPCPWCSPNSDVNFKLRPLREGVMLSLRSIWRGADLDFVRNRNDVRKILPGLRSLKMTPS